MEINKPQSLFKFCKAATLKENGNIVFDALVKIPFVESIEMEINSELIQKVEEIITEYNLQYVRLDILYLAAYCKSPDINILKAEWDKFTQNKSSVWTKEDEELIYTLNELYHYPINKFQLKVCSPTKAIKIESDMLIDAYRTKLLELYKERTHFYFELPKDVREYKAFFENLVKKIESNPAKRKRGRKEKNPLLGYKIEYVLQYLEKFTHLNKDGSTHLMSDEQARFLYSLLIACDAITTEATYERGIVPKILKRFREKELPELNRIRGNRPNKIVIPLNDSEE